MSTREYNSIVKDFSDGIYHFLCRMLSNNEVASDLTQEVFLELWKNRKKVEPMKVKSWLFTTARNKALNYIKKHKESPLASDFDWGNNAEEESFESRDILEQGLKRLTPEERSLVLLRDLEGYDYIQIAELANIPSQHVKARLFRARKKLKAVIEKILTPTING